RWRPPARRGPTSSRSPRSSSPPTCSATSATPARPCTRGSSPAARRPGRRARCWWSAASPTRTCWSRSRRPRSSPDGARGRSAALAVQLHLQAHLARADAVAGLDGDGVAAPDVPLAVAHGAVAGIGRRRRVPADAVALALGPEAGLAADPEGGAGAGPQIVLLGHLVAVGRDPADVLRRPLDLVGV